MDGFEDCRSIQNPHILGPVLKKVDFIMESVHKIKSNDLFSPNFDRVFMVDDQNIGIAAFYAQIRDKECHLFGCIEIKIEFINANSIDEVIDALIRDEECNFKIRKCRALTTQSPDLKIMFYSTNIIIDLIKTIKEVKSSDRIYGIIQHNFNSGGVFFWPRNIQK